MEPCKTCGDTQEHMPVDHCIKRLQDERDLYKAALVKIATVDASAAEMNLTASHALLQAK